MVDPRARAEAAADARPRVVAECSGILGFKLAPPVGVPCRLPRLAPRAKVFGA